MKIGFVVNRIETESPTHTTTLLAATAHRMGHTVFLISVGDMSYLQDGNLGALAKKPPAKDFKSNGDFFKSILDPKNKSIFITSENLDVLYLRYNPPEEHGERVWAQTAGIMFGQIAASRDVIVLNHPDTLAYAINKMYFQHFPEEVRPNSIITRNMQQIKEFIGEYKKVILKPLFGTAGKNVFLYDHSEPNLNQIVEVLRNDGYIILQEYLPKAREGDIRLFLMNGKPLVYKDKTAIIRRVNNKGDIRSNMSTGGHAEKVKVTDEILDIAEKVRPKLIRDGLFLVGLDIIGNKLIEINTISSGGLNIASKLARVNFGERLIQSIEKKVYYKSLYNKVLTNKELAVME